VPDTSELPEDVATELTLSIDSELRGALSASSGRLGEVYRLYAAGVASPAEIAEQGAAANGGAASNLLVTIRAILFQEIPVSPTVARQAGGAISTLLKSRTLSTLTSIHLQNIREELQKVAGSAGAINEEVVEVTAAAEILDRALRNASGVYAYTLPHYLKYPWDESSGHTLLKVGSTTRGAWQRIVEQVRTTAIPEEPLLLRVYLTDTPEETERVFHRLLDAAGHERSGTKIAGIEWFSTTLVFLDEIAATLGLETLSADLGR
jgi:hypothetical protein